MVYFVLFKELIGFIYLYLYIWIYKSYQDVGPRIPIGVGLGSASLRVKFFFALAGLGTLLEVEI